MLISSPVCGGDLDNKWGAGFLLDSRSWILRSLDSRSWIIWRLDSESGGWILYSWILLEAGYFWWGLDSIEQDSVGVWIFLVRAGFSKLDFYEAGFSKLDS